MKIPGLLADEDEVLTHAPATSVPATEAQIDSATAEGKAVVASRFWTRGVERGEPEPSEQ